MSHTKQPKKNPKAPMTNVCIYRMKASNEAAFRALLDRHWPTLHKEGLVTDEPVQIHRTLDRKDLICYVEIFTWKNSEGPDICHQMPSVMQIWEPMGAILEHMEFLVTDNP